MSSFRSRVWSRWGVALLLVLAVGALLRGARLHEESSNPLALVPTGDEYTVSHWGERIAAGESMGVPYQAPLHALSLALWHQMLSPANARGAQRIQSAALGLGTIWLTFWLGRRVSGEPWVGVGAAACVALHQPLIYYEATLLRDGPATFATALGACALWRLTDSLHGPTSERGRMARALAAGVVWGLAGILRANLLLIAAAIAVALALAALVSLRRSRGGARAWGTAAAVFSVGMAVPVLPWTVHNAAIEGQLYLLPTWNGGPVFFLANRRDHAGIGYSQPSFVRLANVEGEIEGFTREAERREGRTLTPHEVSAYWLGQGLAEVAADPRLYATRLYQRAVLALSTQEYVHARDPRLDSDRSWVLRLPLPGFGLLVGFAFLGALVRPAMIGLRVPGLLALGVLATTIPLAFATRYRLPAVPLVAVLAAVGFRGTGAELVRAFVRHRPSDSLRFGVALGLGIALSVIPVPYDAAQGRWNRAMAWLELERVADAVSEVDAMSGPTRARRRGEFGEVLMQRGRAADAARAFRQALEDEPASRRWRVGLDRAARRPAH